jgi:hypothetical protein
MRNKVIKAQFNKMCVSGMILDMNSAAIFAGEKKTTAIEVTPDGINIQPGTGNPLYLSTHDIRGPGYKASTVPADYLPGAANVTARKDFDLPFLEQTVNILNVSSAYGAMVGVLL